jgi:curved DNA-binding protein
MLSGAVEKIMDYKDYYKTLHITKEASQEEIKRAYRKLARKYHPDINRDASAEARFKEINEANEVLKDTEKRKAYDSFGDNWQTGEEFRPPHDWRDRFREDGHESPRTSNQHYSDFFESLFGGHPGRFTSENFSSTERDGGRGHDLNAKISISLEDSYHGAKRTITLNRMVNEGNGYQTLKPQSLQITIPKGIMEGQQIRLEGQGDTGFAMGPSGNLFLEIVFEPHPIFTAKKRDIFFTLAVTPWEAALGASIAVPTLGGNVDLKLPANSQTGKKLRMKGRGLSSKNQVGNQFVTLTIHTPAAHTTEQREFYERMGKIMPYNPRSGLEVEK